MFCEFSVLSHFLPLKLDVNRISKFTANRSNEIRRSQSAILLVSYFWRQGRLRRFAGRKQGHLSFPI